MWKKLLVLVAVVGLMFAVVPTADACSYAKSCSFAVNLAAGAQGQGYYTEPGYTAYGGGQIGGMVNATGTSSTVLNNGSTCALAIAGGIATQNQSISAPGLTASQSQCVAGISISATSSSSSRGFVD